MREPSGIEWVAGLHRFRLDAVLGRGSTWQPILRFDLHIHTDDVAHATAKKSWLIDNMRDV